jgi:hypothetical protein
MTHPNKRYKIKNIEIRYEHSSIVEGEIKLQQVYELIFNEILKENKNDNESRQSIRTF